MLAVAKRRPPKTEQPPINRQTANAMLTVVEVARALSISRDGVYRLLKDDPTFPQPIKLASEAQQGAARYSSEALFQWIDQRAKAAKPKPERELY